MPALKFNFWQICKKVSKSSGVFLRALFRVFNTA
jgi:hypothetical protein